MSHWRNLDFDPPLERTEGPPEPAAGPANGPERPGARQHGRLAGMPVSSHPAVAAARGFYLLKNWQGAVDALPRPLLDEPSAEGGWLLAALAHARLGEHTAAEQAFAGAIRRSADDLFTRCAFAAFLLHHHRDPEARATLAGVEVLRCWGVGVLGVGSRVLGGTVGTPRPNTQDPTPNTPTPQRLIPVAGQLLAACDWAEGQRQLGAGQAVEAADRFAATARQFLLAGEALATARRALPQRLGAAYLGQVVSLVVAGRTEAALQLYGRMRPTGVAFAPPLEQFVKGLHDLCRLLPQADAAERSTVADQLTAVVTGARMLVALWDGAHPVSIVWHGAWGSDE